MTLPTICLYPQSGSNILKQKRVPPPTQTFLGEKLFSSSIDFYNYFFFCCSANKVYFQQFFTATEGIGSLLESSLRLEIGCVGSSRKETFQDLRFHTMKRNMPNSFKICSKVFSKWTMPGLFFLIFVFTTLTIRMFITKFS